MPDSASTLPQLNGKTIVIWKHHLQDEVDAAFLYRILSEKESDIKPKEIFLRLAEVEDRHCALIEKMFQDHNIKVRVPLPSLKARILAWFATKFGSSYLISLMLRTESKEVKTYLKLGKVGSPDYFKKITNTLAKESIEHTEALKYLTGQEAEPWHQPKSGGLLRNVIYGFNDGLTANFGLLAGVIGANVETHLILLSGFAGMVADALSMGSSGYLAAKSEQEVYSHEIDMEKEEISLMPEVEEEELSLIYEAKGIEKERARLMAKEVMSNPQRALKEKVREELGITGAYTTPLKEGLVTGTATAFGAFIPIAAFLFSSGVTAIWISFIVSMLSHFGVGAARSLFTGRSIIRSGMDMFLIGLGVAVVGYYAGEFLMKLLS